MTLTPLSHPSSHPSHPLDVKRPLLRSSAFVRAAKRLAKNYPQNAIEIQSALELLTVDAPRAEPISEDDQSALSAITPENTYLVGFCSRINIDLRSIPPRATGITVCLENGGTIENAQAIAAHESPRTTKLYDRTADEITADEVERIAI